MNVWRDLAPSRLMPNLALRALLATALFLPFGERALAEPKLSPATAEDQRILAYAKPDDLVDIGGRHINLTCIGAGRPTVILMAGLFSWSVDWYKVQPTVAKKARVCAFDRAGYGFSDAAPRPPIISEVVEDLHSIRS